MLGHTVNSLSFETRNEKVLLMIGSRFIQTLQQTPARLEFGAVKLVFHFGFWIVALLIGLASGVAAVGFRLAIEWLQKTAYGTPDVNRLHSFAETLAWYWVVLIPTIGGVIVGIIFHTLTKDGRVRSVADVIEAAALHEGRVEQKEGIASALASLITLSTGGSAGREGPVVHIAALISSKTCEWIGARGITARDLLGCGVAAAVAASFNAPIAGALFALAVVLLHFALHAFAPIVIASVAGAVINQIAFGDVREFNLPVTSQLEFYAELPAFMILGLVCGAIAVVLMKSIFFADDVAGRVQSRLGLPRWLRPSVAGFLLGLLAIKFPMIIGVGYETTFAALNGQIVMDVAILFVAVKVLAVAITMGGRMGGGVFSPSLMIGALTGLAFGEIATSVLPHLSGGASIYAMAGMAAVAASVLGAPISTTLIVFEMTGDWQTGLAVLVAVSMASALSAKFVEKSFFLTQLARRKINLAAGPQDYLLTLFKNVAIMRPLNEPKTEHWDMVEHGAYVGEHGTLAGAMPVFRRTGARYVPVLRLGAQGDTNQIIGLLYEVDALRAYNEALAATAAEEHS